MPNSSVKTTILTAILFLYTASQPVFAGQPFFTDDPEPVEYQHWEINTALQATHVAGNTSGSAPVFDINYGVLPDVELHITPQVAFSHTSADGTHYGYGDTEIGVKYRFIDPEKEDWWPQIAIEPLFELPTGSEGKGLSTTGKMREYLPILLQKDFGDWTTYGGGGYWNNQGIDNKNYWYFGWVLQRRITDTLTLGGELYHQTANTIAGDQANGSSSGFNLGGSYDFNEHYHLLFSAGQGLENISATNAFSYYLDLQWTF